MMAVAIGGVALFSGVVVASAQFHTFWPDNENGYARRGKPVSWDYFWGHPYEMVIFDAKKPNFYVARPDGKTDSVEASQVQMKDEETGKMRTAYRMRYKPTALGDSYLCLEAPLYVVEEEEVFLKDYVKQCIHVMAEEGWDRPVGMEIEIIPVTRPYGMEEGFVFKGQALFKGKPLADAWVEIEKFNGFHVNHENLPTDQYGNENVSMITRVSKTDLNGYVVYTLDEPGWWMVSVSHADGEINHEGRDFPLVKRGGLWIYVEKRFIQR
jgi:cobalt/nickel transport protein